MIKCEQLITSRKQFGDQGGSFNPATYEIKVDRVWRDSVSPLSTEARSQRKKSLEPDGLFIKFKQQIKNLIEI